MLSFLRRKEKISTASDLSQLMEMFGGSGSPVSFTRDQAMKFAPVFMAVRVLAESFAVVPCNLFKTNGRRREKAVDHPLYRVLHAAPNHFQTSQEFREMIIWHLCFQGNFFAFKVRTVRGISSLLPIQPSSVRVRMSSDFEINYDVTFPDGTIEAFTDYDIFHIKLLSFDGINGVTPIEYCKGSIGLGIANENYGARFFKNDATPGGVIHSDKKLNDDQTKDLRDNWNKLLSGDGSHGTAVLSGGVKWLQVQMKAVDAQFLETRKASREEIAGIFKVPPSMVGVLDKTTVGNSEQQAISFIVHAMLPLFTRFEQRVNFSLLSESEQKNYFCKCNVSGLARGDMAARGAFYRILFELGVLSSNDIRELEDMNPRDGGDEYYVALNMGNASNQSENAQAN